LIFVFSNISGIYFSISITICTSNIFPECKNVLKCLMKAKMGFWSFSRFSRMIFNYFSIIFSCSLWRGRERQSCFNFNLNPTNSFDIHSPESKLLMCENEKESLMAWRRNEHWTFQIDKSDCCLRLDTIITFNDENL
jgi:hypothetical protein